MGYSAMCFANTTYCNRLQYWSNPDASYLRLYLSLNSTVTTEDTELGGDSVTSLVAGNSVEKSFSEYAPSLAGTSYLGICVDVVSGEVKLSNHAEPDTCLEGLFSFAICWYW